MSELTQPDPSAPRPNPTVRLAFPDMEKPGERIGHYKLLQLIGEGGMGSVWMAEQTEPVRRRVALKVIKLGMDTKQVIGRFEAERQALALMDHTNIAKVLDAGATENGRPFFAMELVKGIPITRYCDDHKLNTEERLKLFTDVCHAIQHAHQKGIIHRDIKPSNILVTLNDGVPMPKVIDFGIAKATGGQTLTDKTVFTALEQFIGTPAYMSPEQAEMNSLDIDTRSDIYALGVLLYELLTGKTPFDAKALVAKGLDEIRRIIREEEPPRPSTRLSTLDVKEQTILASQRHSEPPKLVGIIRGDLDWIVMKTLEKDRTRRYDTANGLAMDVQRYLNSEPIVARPPSNLYRFQKLIRRNKLAFAAGTAVATSLLIGLALTTWMFFKERMARTEATVARQSEMQQRLQAEAAEKAAETQARRAEASALQANRTLSDSDFLQASRLIAEGENDLAMAYLSRSLSADPKNAAALTRLTTLLMYQPFHHLMLHQAEGVNSVKFSPDGGRLVTASSDGSARVWDAHTGLPLTEPIKHAKSVRDAQFSPDGKRIVTASDDGTARVWDARTGQPLTEPLTHAFTLDDFKALEEVERRSKEDSKKDWAELAFKEFNAFKEETGGLRVTRAQFSSDGKRIVSTDAMLIFSSEHQATVHVWDAHSGQRLSRRIIEPLDRSSVLVEFSPDGEWAITPGEESNAASLWDVQTGRQLIVMKHNEEVKSAHFSKDAKRIVTVSDDGTARVWDAQTGQPLTEPLKHDLDPLYTNRLHMVCSAEFSQDGKRVVTASRDGTARVWDAQTGQPVGQSFKHDGNVFSAQFSSDGGRVVTLSPWTPRVWSVQTGQMLSALKDKVGTDSVQISPDGIRIATISRNDSAGVWDLRPGQPLTEPLQHKMPAKAVQFSPDSQRIATASENDSAQVWDARTGKALGVPIKHNEGVLQSPFSPDGRRLVTVSTNGCARVWDLVTGRSLMQTLEHDGRVASAQFSPDGRLLVTTAKLKNPGRGWFGWTSEHQKNAWVWDVQTAKLLTKVTHDSGVFWSEFSPDGKQILTVSDDWTVRVWDARTGQRLTELEHDKRFESAHFSPDGKQIVTGGYGGARVWDAQTGQPLTEMMSHNSPVTSARFSPDGMRIVTIASGHSAANPDNGARIWDAQTGRPLSGLMQHSNPVDSAEFSPDGKRILTIARADTGYVADPRGDTVYVWDAQSGQPLVEPFRHRKPVSSAQFSPDGKRIATVSDDGLARVWNLSPSQQDCPDWLHQLVEAISGQRLNEQGASEPTKLNRAETINQIRVKLDSESTDDDWVIWVRWFLADRSTRTISPFSKITVPEYIENRLNENTPASLAQAEPLALGNSALLERISAARKKLEPSRPKPTDSQIDKSTP